MSFLRFFRADASARLARFRDDRRGVTIIEFAFVAGPLMALIAAILQTSLVFFAQQNLETASEKAVRQLVTGNLQNASTTQAQFKTLVCSKLPSFMKCANVMVDVQSGTSFSSISTVTQPITYDGAGNPTNAWKYQPGGAGQITVVKIMYIWNVEKGPLGFDLSTMSSARRLLVSTSVFKSEPYS